ncbi:MULTISPECIES: glycosyltransferase [unclassified Nodularia (in: cyanobacteria)]|uniref:glycosyltransferase n=1 Tax=unclassified Nodularia (in: cyanobacteria) TaxID=2656917 RepID=UPI00187F1BF0|nr:MULTISPECIES: glycosyltransferase [unclassified Nodularia (in: cyanobacteria)]MBE9199984.1 glycosyltransferase [Nodularia sp. LEGE 06071]MCC2693634.1 glycosyltransferase [Nodularia sp. LEGE 04288]
MKIAYVSREFGPITGGGIGTYIANITKYMAKRGHDVYLITDCFTESNLHYLPPNVTLIRTEPALSDRHFFTYNQNYSDRVYQTLKLLTPFDVIEFAEYNAEGFTTIRAKKLLNEFANTQLVVKLHTPRSLLVEIDEEKHTTTQTPIDIYLEDYCVKNADIVTSPSASLAEYFTKRLDVNCITRSPYPLLLSTIKPTRKFVKSQIEKITFIGSIQVRKGVDTFIEAAKIILAKEPNFIFEMYGRDTYSAPFYRSYTEYLQKRIPYDLKDKIIFKGAAPYAEIPEILLDTCFCVFPSRWENWANVCLEAMSFGCVVIGSQEGGMSEMIEHGNSGFLINPSHAEEIAHTILDNYRNIAYLQQISETAQSSIQQWCDPELASAQVEESYKIASSPKNWLVNQEAKISVVIPLYNQGNYIEETIQSIQESTYKNVEIIVVNDGSTDSETNKIFQNLSGVIKVFKPNGGLSSARNAGIKVSSGEYIMLLDSDDKIHPEYIEKAVIALINNHELSYVGCYTRNFEAYEYTQAPVGFIPELMLFNNTNVVNSTNLYRRSAIAKVGDFDEELISYEDWDYFISLYENGCAGDILPLELFLYRRHYDSMVWTVAQPRRTQLIQYMLGKHQKTVSSYSHVMVQYLTQLWKDKEIEYEVAISGSHSYEIDELKKRIWAMESSKFWQLRKLWFKVKYKLGLSKELD